MIDPNGTLLDFMAKLPATIKDATLQIVAMSLQPNLRGDPDEDAEAILQAFLAEGVGTLAAYRCGMVAGGLEVALAGDARRTSTFWNQVAEKSPPTDNIAKMSIRAPLIDRHREAARRSFQGLREGPLSPEALQKWRMHQSA